MIFFKQHPLNERVYQNIFDLPLSVFLDVVCDKNIQALIKKGRKATQEECIESWELIYNKYLEAISDKNSEYIIKLQNRIELLKRRIYLVATCATALRGWVKMNELCGFHDVPKVLVETIQRESNFDITDLVNFEKDIQFAENNVRRYQIEVENKKSELEVLTPKDNKPVTREAFISTLSRMSRWAKIQYKATEITVFEFVKNLNDWKQEIDAANAEIKRKK
jgi:hypothetical protein